MRRRAPIALAQIHRNQTERCAYAPGNSDFKSSMKIIYLDVGRLSENCTLNLPSAIHFINKIADQFIFHIGWLAGWLADWMSDCYSTLKWFNNILAWAVIIRWNGWLILLKCCWDDKIKNEKMKCPSLMNHFECEWTSVNWLNAAHLNERSRSTSDLEIMKTITKINTAALLSFDEISALLWNASVRHHNLFNEQHFKYLLISILFYSIVHIFCWQSGHNTPRPIHKPIRNSTFNWSSPIVWSWVFFFFQKKWKNKMLNIFTYVIVYIYWFGSQNGTICDELMR